MFVLLPIYVRKSEIFYISLWYFLKVLVSDIPEPFSALKAALNPFIPDNWYWRLPSRGAGLFTWPCWTSWSSHRPTPPSCGWHPFPQGINCPTCLGVICKLAVGALDPTVPLSPIPLIKTLNIPYPNNSFV